MHLLQVCNVGNICGGTAACAWTISRALAPWRHTVVFPSPPTTETERCFAHARVEVWSDLTHKRFQRTRPDVVILHNTPADRVGRIAAPLTIQYLHSRISPAPADVTLACSRWLAESSHGDRVDGVLYQPVPRPPGESHAQTRPLRTRLIVGRLCTPAAHKWPGSIIPLYAHLAARFPEIEWEFVGCPPSLVEPLTAACRQQVRFHAAGWSARAHLTRWDALLYHHPSLSESFGRIAAEAMRAGCIPILDDRGGFREQVRPACGFLCRDLNGFASAVDAISDAHGRRRLSRAAVVHAEERFSLPRFANRFRRLLLTILHDDRPGRGGRAAEPD